MKKYKVFLVSILVITISMIGVGMNVFSKQGNKYDVVFYVNEEPVYLGEFMLFFNKNKTKILKEFGNEKNGEEFWNTKVLESKTPLDLAKILTIEDLKEIKIVQIVAKKYEIVENIDYQNFVDELNKENKRREKALNNGEILYGPEQYKEEEYFLYLLEDMKNKLKIVIEKENSISEAEIKKYYEENKESLYKFEDKVEVKIVSIPYIDSVGVVNEKIKELALENIEKIKGNVEYSKKLNFAKDKDIKINSYEFKKENKKDDDEFLAILKEEALKLNVGDISNIVDFNRAYNIMICNKREEQGYKILEDVKSEIKEEIVIDIYRLQLKLINSSCEIKVNNKVLNTIK